MSIAVKGDAVRGHLEGMLLALLEQAPAHGFELVKRLAERGNGELQLKEGTIYPVLYRLEKGGLVLAEWEADDSGRKGPRRRIYSLTKSGHKQLATSRQEWTQFVQVVGNVLGVIA
jgi:DNA-binding PadR family transcriptional regulator